MKRSLISALVYLLGNAAGLLLATLLVPGFKIGLTAFVVAVLIFSALILLLKPLILKLTRKQLPALEGGIALVTTLAGLLLTNLLVGDMQIGGIRNWLLATLLVWVGALIAGLILNRYLLPSRGARKRAGE